MAYRNDLEALEARYRALDTELTERVRERDEVKQMLDEARDYTDWVERGPERRRARQRRIAISVFATAALVIAGVGYSMFAHRTRKFDEALARFSALTDEMCACKTKACADGVTAEITEWVDTLAKSDSATDTPSADDIKRFAPVTERYTDCATKLMND